MGNLLDKEEVRWCGAETGCLTERGDQGLDQNTRAQQCDHPEGRGHASGASALGPEQEWQAGMRRGEAPSLGVADDFTFEGVFSGDVMSPGARRHGDSSSVEDRGGDREEFGTGILYKIRRNGQMEVVAFVKDSDAYNCGFIQDGDQLNSVDSVPISVMTWSQLRTALGGTRGSTVVLKFLRPLNGKVTTHATSPDKASAKTIKTDSLDLSQISSPEKKNAGSPTKAEDGSPWKSSAMRSWAPSYIEVIVELQRLTPREIIEKAANAANSKVIGMNVEIVGH